MDIFKCKYTFQVKPVQKCRSCDYKLCEEDLEIFDHLENLESSLSNEIKVTLVYIAGYNARNDTQPSEYETHFYYKKYEKFTKYMDPGKLKAPSEQICQWLFFVLSFSKQ